MNRALPESETGNRIASSRVDDPISVLFFTTSPFIGGACYGARSIIRELDKTRFRALIAISSPNPDIAPFFEQEGIETVSIPGTRLSRFRWDIPQDYWRTVQGLADVIRKRRIQILHSVAPRIAIVGPAVRRLTGVKFVWQLASLGQAWYNHLLARLPDRAPCVSRAVYEEFGARKHMSVIYNGPWTENLTLEEWRQRRRELRASLGIAENAPVVGCIANFQFWKGVHLVVEAFAKVLKQVPNAKLVHIGGEVPTYEQYYKDVNARIDELGIGAATTRLGFRSDAYRYYPAFDVLVHVPVCEIPGRPHEAFGQTVAEGGGYRLPVITSREGGPAEIIQGGVTGEFIEPGNVDELAAKMTGLLQDPVRARQMGEAGYQRYQECFTISREVRQYEALYEQLVGEGRN